MPVRSGVVDNDTVNCDSVVEIGTKAMQKFTEKLLGYVQLYLKDRVLPLLIVSSYVKESITSAGALWSSDDNIVRK